jgi:hypothetical protein
MLAFLLLACDSSRGADKLKVDGGAGGSDGAGGWYPKDAGGDASPAADRPGDPPDVGSDGASCAAGWIRCKGVCIDPRADPQFCGATEGCGVGGGSAGTACFTGQSCMTFVAKIVAMNLPAGGLVVGDLERDGKPDLVLTDSPDKAVGVLLGKGDGSFTGAVGYPAVGVEARAPVLADFNGDGKLDVACATGATGANFGGSINIFLGNGDGTLQPARNFEGGPASTWLRSGDLNKDGFVDLVAVNLDSSGLGIYLGNGDGTFKAFTLAQGVPTGLVLGDLNGDGNLDLTTSQNGPTLYVSLGNGDGTFKAFQDAGRTQGLVLENAGDLDGDGKLDLVSAIPTGGSSHALGVSLGNGDGTFKPATPWSVPGRPTSVVAVDVDGDRRTDLIAVQKDSNELSLLLGNGDGTFQAVQSLLKLPGLCGLSSPVIADLDGDGKPDLAFACPDAKDVRVVLDLSSRPPPKCQ